MKFIGSTDFHKVRVEVQQAGIKTRYTVKEVKCPICGYPHAQRAWVEGTGIECFSCPHCQRTDYSE